MLSYRASAVRKQSCSPSEVSVASSRTSEGEESVTSSRNQPLSPNGDGSETDSSVASSIKCPLSPNGDGSETDSSVASAASRRYVYSYILQISIYLHCMYNRLNKLHRVFLK